MAGELEPCLLGPLGVAHQVARAVFFGHQLLADPEHIGFPVGYPRSGGSAGLPLDRTWPAGGGTLKGASKFAADDVAASEF
jgi:hypothetical protein